MSQATSLSSKETQHYYSVRSETPPRLERPTDRRRKWSVQLRFFRLKFLLDSFEDIPKDLHNECLN